MNIAQTQINIVSDSSWQDLQQLDPWVFKIQFKFILGLNLKDIILKFTAACTSF